MYDKGPSPEEVAAGHRFYTRRSLRVYDPMILGFFSRVAWRCPATRILHHYDEHVSGNHLDVGVGTGSHQGRGPGTRSTAGDLPAVAAQARRRARAKLGRLR